MGIALIGALFFGCGIGEPPFPVMKWIRSWRVWLFILITLSIYCVYCSYPDKNNVQEISRTILNS